jgi:hypothetical protein
VRDEEDEPSPSEYVDNISFERYWYQYCVREILVPILCSSTGFFVFVLFVFIIFSNAQ